jgi:hypothetical protein
MTTLTSSATLTVSPGATVTVSASTIVAPALGYGAGGTGRLIHPTLGTYDYDVTPNEWVNLMGDVIIPPIRSNNLTLSGATNALWAGTIRDVLCEEHWTVTRGDFSMRTAQLAMLLAMFQTPPDPTTSWVLWYPNYATNLGYKVLLESLTVQGLGTSSAGKSMGGIALDIWSISQEPVVTGAVALGLRIIGRA